MINGLNEEELNSQKMFIYKIKDIKQLKKEKKNKKKIKIKQK